MIFISLNLYSQNIYNEPHSIYKDGKAILWYEVNGIRIASSAEKTSKKYGFGKEVRVDLAFMNDNHESLEINPSIFTASAILKKKRKILRIYSEKEYEKKVRRNLFWFGPENVASTSVDINSSAAVKDEYGNTKATVTSSSKAKSTYFTGEYDRAVSDASVAIKESYIKRNTLFKDEVQEGMLIIENPQSEHLELSIVIAGNTYVFSYNLDSK